MENTHGLWPDRSCAPGRRRAEQAHKQFYGGIHDLRAPNVDDSARLATDADPVGARVGAQAVAYDGSSPPVRAAGPQPHKPQATVDDCIDCHGAFPHVPPPPGLLPPFGRFPIPGGFPMFRDLPGAIPSGPRNEGRKECELQERNDRRICGGQPTPQDRAICHASASNRRAYCDRRDGTIGHPALDTAKRLRGNPPLRR